MGMFDIISPSCCDFKSGFSFNTTDKVIDFLLGCLALFDKKTESLYLEN